MLVFEQIDDETINIRWNDSIITTVNHDEDGWAGMDKIVKAMKELADCTGTEYIDLTL